MVERSIYKAVKLGSVRGAPRPLDYWAEVRFDGKQLAISSVIGPRSNDDAHGSCGQSLPGEYNFVEFAPGWDQERIDRFNETWERWHLNDMRAGCEHQRASWKLDEEVDGLLGKPCEVCGYRYGSAWLFEEVPQDVLDFLEALPAAEGCPWRGFGQPR